MCALFRPSKTAPHDVFEPCFEDSGHLIIINIITPAGAGGETSSSILFPETSDAE